ncbi:phosphatase PAP2 family protein [Cellvibrio sp.]|uniref:phosphatase PAP2 family protein n=1 Tax=Cellvibrio sp. TaxID=1965322 RepID=UPI0039648565
MTTTRTRLLSLTSITLIGVAILLSAIKPLNMSIFSAINSALPSKALWVTITNSADVIFVGCLLFITLRKHQRLLTCAVLCGISIHYIVKFAKDSFAILRPEYGGLDHIVRLGPKLASNNYAMPSGHVASAFMAIIFIIFAHQLKGWKLLLLFIYGLLVALSRMAVGAHWPADVCAGAAIGITLGLIFVELANKESFWFDQHINVKKTVQYLTLLAYIPFVVLAITHAKSIHGFTSLINQGIMVLIGLVALGFWLVSAASLMNKKAPLAEY